jgi:hypothetical protein
MCQVFETYVIMFQMFQVYVASVSFKCCKSKSGFTYATMRASVRRTRAARDLVQTSTKEELSRDAKKVARWGWDTALHGLTDWRGRGDGRCCQLLPNKMRF